MYIYVYSIYIYIYSLYLYIYKWHIEKFRDISLVEVSVENNCPSKRYSHSGNCRNVPLIEVTVAKVVT
jgi:hypothetical protein